MPRIVYILLALLIVGGAWQWGRYSATRQNSWQIRNDRSGLCLDIPDGASENHLQVQQYTCREAGDPLAIAQLWQVIEFEAGVQLRNRRSGLCLDVPYGHSEPNLSVQQYDCRDADDPWVTAQLWQLSKISEIGDGVQIRNRRSSLCLDVPYGHSDKQLGIQQYECRDADNLWTTAQLWRLSKMSD